MNNKLELLKTAILKDQFNDFLTGLKKEYYLVCLYADIPTDPDQVFDLIKRYGLEFPNSDIWTKFENEIISMTSNQIGSWLSVYYLSMYLSYRKYKNKDFINLFKIIQSIEDGLLKYKDVLIQNKDWCGVDFHEGLWGDVIRLVGILNKKYDLNIDLYKTLSVTSISLPNLRKRKFEW